jgi:hypothetical protein
MGSGRLEPPLQGHAQAVAANVPVIVLGLDSQRVEANVT